LKRDNPAASALMAKMGVRPEDRPQSPRRLSRNDRPVEAAGEETASDHAFH
jgi:hypothetical protein